MENANTMIGRHILKRRLRGAFAQKKICTLNFENFWQARHTTWRRK